MTADVQHPKSRTSQLGKFLILVTFAGLAVVMTATFPPLDTAHLKTQYQSYRAAIEAAATFKDTHALLAVPTDATKNEYDDFERLTNDDVGYPLYLTWLVSAGIIKFDASRVNELISADLVTSRKMLKEHFASITFPAGVYFYYGCLFFFATILVLRSQMGEMLVVVSFVLLLAIAPIWIKYAFERVVHSHSLIPGLCILTLCLPVLSGFATHDDSLKRTLGLGAAILVMTVVFLVRKSTGYFAAAAFVAFVVLSPTRFPSKVLVLAILPASFFLCPAIIKLIDEQRSHSGVILVPQDAAGSDFGHPIFHALLVGVAGFDNNSLGLHSESDVIKRVRDVANDPDLSQDSAKYIATARKVYFQYVREHPGEIAWNYMERFAQVGQEVPKLFKIPGYVFLPCCLLLLTSALYSFTVGRQSMQVGSPGSVFDFVVFLAPANMLASLVRPTLSPGIAAAMAIIICAALASLVLGAARLLEGSASWPSGRRLLTDLIWRRQDIRNREIA